MQTRYDPECETLARYFLHDIAGDVTELQVHELAGVIQEAIEDWFVAQLRPKPG